MTKGVDQGKRGAWLARLERFRTSGQTVAKFCEGEKVSVQSYYYWVRRLGLSSAARVTSESPPGSATTLVASDSRVHFRFGGGVLVSIPADCLEAIRCLVQGQPGC
jgi:transposase